jgi:phosphopantothenate-cysteine ligase/phosphopantothenoylcysteine decarboxylase/phosphopantothenate--cysteine ligase
MRVLVTAGNTHTPIDRVRVLTNVFTGRTGAAVAAEFRRRGHDVLLVTSQPETAAETPTRTYRTFDDLAGLLAELVPQGWDVIAHSAAVSDYAVAGVFDADRRDVTAGKVKSSHPELWLKLVPTPKLIDKFRPDWGFRGVLVKFKLEVGRTVPELLAVAERARVASRADLMVANTLETAAEVAHLGPLGGQYVAVPRAELAARLADAVEDRCAQTR